jgi:hypothetical protein
VTAAERELGRVAQLGHGRRAGAVTAIAVAELSLAAAAPAGDLAGVATDARVLTTHRELDGLARIDARRGRCACVCRAAVRGGRAGRRGALSDLAVTADAGDSERGGEPVRDPKASARVCS